MDGRYDYIPGEGTSGVVVYDGRFVYSYHATDPASEKLLNAFDLVRVHKFGDDDSKKSFAAMEELASRDELVSSLLLAERRETAAQDFEGSDWETPLVRDKNGVLVNSLRNLKFIMEHDAVLKGIVFNQLADNMEICEEVPWSYPGKFWRAVDDAQLIDYLGALDNVYVRVVTRKTLCAAVARVRKPSIKFDNILVLNGPQGIGKFTIVALLGSEWYSDSLSLTDMNDKTTAEKLQGYWIMEIGELAGMRKADINKVKAFISRQDDKYRASFGRCVTPHPRKCIFFGTINCEGAYLRDGTDNRRFWTVKTPGGKRKPWDLSLEEIKQIWAKAVARYDAGESLYFDAELEFVEKAEQDAVTEQDEREGLVRLYLDELLPANWNQMGFYEQREFLSGDELSARRTEKRQTVSNMEIWCELAGGKRICVPSTAMPSLPLW